MVAERRCEAASLSVISTQLAAGDCLVYQSDTIVDITGTRVLIVKDDSGSPIYLHASRPTLSNATYYKARNHDSSSYTRRSKYHPLQMALRPVSCIDPARPVLSFQHLDSV
jgi:hypothetical protein